ncbi:G5 domain-containing protein [Sporosarcina sp. resist]|uniref:G5 domain-containing protein n=1 Tax=Sporosarcina sp. resist TaxID=2762563 RepID=UPI00164D088E|nr:G5 domain-containing protein [Sporosarcina sp. resist]QNK89951.1 G5 domain-containing protein [Sporosarcina sp. resist]
MYKRSMNTRFIVRVLSASFILLLSVILSLSTVFASSGGELSTIAGNKIDSKDKKEIEQMLLQKVLEWKESSLLLKTTNGDMELDTSLFHFHMKETINEFEVQTKKSWYQFWKKKVHIDLPIQFSIDEEIIELLKKDSAISVDETMDQLNEEIGYQLTSVIQAVQSENSAVEERIALVVKEVAVNRNSLDLILQELDGLKINPEEKTSYLESVTDISELGDQDTLDYMASIMYSLILQSNYIVLERHASPVKLQTFLPGTEANVNQLMSKDLIFKNPNIVSGTFKFTIVDNQLTAELLSIPLDVRIESYQVEEQEVKPRTIYRYSDKLPLYVEEVIEVGESGVKVSTFRMTSEKHGSFETEELISTDFYPPTHRVVVKSSKQLETESEELPAGEDGANLGTGNSKQPSEIHVTDEAGTDSSSGGGIDSSSGEKVEGNNEEVEYDKGGNIIKPSGK